MKHNMFINLYLNSEMNNIYIIILVFTSLLFHCFHFDVHFQKGVAIQLIQLSHQQFHHLVNLIQFGYVQYDYLL